MLDDDFKLKVVETLGRLEANQLALMGKPSCEKKSVKKDVGINRRLILYLFVAVVVKAIV